MKFNNNGTWEEIKVKASDTLPIGAIIPYSSSTAPTGWLVCDGSAVSRTTYSKLFEVIGTAFGTGDGSTTFNLPDFSGRVFVGQDTDDTDFDTIGESGGESTHTLTIAEMPSHSHSVKFDQIWGTSGGTTSLGTNSGGPYTGSGYVYNTGGGGAHNNLQPYITCYMWKRTA